MRLLSANTKFDREYIETLILGSHVIYSDNRLVIMSVENTRAAFFWSEGANWCVAEHNFYNDYRKQGRLFLFKQLQNNRHYFLSVANREFRNGKNRRLSLASFINRFPRAEYQIRSLLRDDWKAGFYFGLVNENAQYDHSLNLRDLGLSHLPDGLSVRDDLVLCHNPISALPSQLFVGGVLDIRNTQITSIPKCSQVLGKIIS